MDGRRRRGLWLAVAVLVVCLPGLAAPPPDGARRDLVPGGTLRTARLVTDRPVAPGLPPGWAARDAYEIESGPVDFGRMRPGEPHEIPAAIRVRVRASASWALELVPDSPLRVLDGGGGSIPHSRMSVRTSETGTFLPLGDRRRIVVARGAATGRGGRLVVIDLRLELEDEDEIGVYGCDYRLVLKPL